MQIRLDDKRLGETVTLDHSVQKFEVLIRSMSGVSEADVKNLIQKKYEVVSIQEMDRRDYVKA